MEIVCNLEEIEAKGTWEYNVEDFNFICSVHQGRGDQIVKSINSLQLDSDELHWLDLGAGPGDLVCKIVRDQQNRHPNASICGHFVDPDLKTCLLLSDELAQLNFLHKWEIYESGASEFLGASINNPHYFNLVTAIHSLYYLPNWENVVKLMMQVASKKSIFIALKSGQTIFYQRMRRLYESLEIELPYPFFGEDLFHVIDQLELSASLQKRVSSIHLPPNPDDLLRLIQFVWRIPHHLLHSRRQEIWTFVGDVAGQKLDFVDLHFTIEDQS